jgi:hypothetical protein
VSEPTLTLDDLEAIARSALETIPTCGKPVVHACFEQQQHLAAFGPTNALALIARIRQLEAAIAAPSVREWRADLFKYSICDSSDYIDGWNDALDEIRRGLDLQEPLKTSQLPTTTNNETKE